MKVTYNWLKKYVDFDWSADELAERLTMLGLEVEGITQLGNEFEGIVVAQVLTKEKHPNADKLTVCRVNDGQGERQIVCGATNFKPGDKVPLILPGHSLPAQPGEKPITIKVGKIRGVESQGMMCSPKELGLSDDAAGLMILPEDAPVGKPFAEYLGRAERDVVFDLEITPNRPDLNSVIGIAREISAVTGNPLRLPEVHLPAGEPPVEQLVSVRLEDPELCPRYTARVIRGVRVGPSPDWLRHTLEKVGLRSINNVVDVTNYVMLETGQPLHAFDYHLLAKGPEGKPTIIVRRAADGEKFTTLDEKEHTLTRDHLLIADTEKGVALAGVMGGLNSEINDQTKDVLLESAWFLPSNIRRTSKTLGLRTDSSYRFERGADIGITDWASQRAAQLILETAGGQLADGVVDAYPQPVAPREIALRFHKTDELLGVNVPPEEQTRHLTRLGLELLTQPDPAATQQRARFRIPTFRVDLKREVDLIEEVARLYGVERIPATAPRGAIGRHPFDTVHDVLAEARTLLTGLGLDEAQGQTLISDAAAVLATPAETLVRLANPLSSEMNVLRPSLLPGLLGILQHNLNHKNRDVALFEVGRVFVRQSGELRESRRVAMAMTGARSPAFWSGSDREARVDVYDLKGVLEVFLDRYGLRGVRYERRSQPTPLFIQSAEIRLGDRLVIGQLGQLLPALAKQYDLRDPVFLAELDLDELLKRRQPARQFKALPAYPSVRRDVALIVAEDITHEAVLEVVKKARVPNLVEVQVFDVFRGANIPEGHKSMAFTFVYRHAERTLTDAEVNQAHEALVEQLKRELHATLREG